MEVYVGVVHKEDGSDYGVSFPEVPGVATAGITLDEAAAMAREALAMHLESFDEDGEARPAQRGIEWVRAHPDAADAQCFIVVAAPPSPSAQVRINITIDPALLERIDRAAHALGFSRSAYLADAARGRLAGTLVSAPASESLDSGKAKQHHGMVYTVRKSSTTGGHFREEDASTSKTSKKERGREREPRRRRTDVR